MGWAFEAMGKHSKAKAHRAPCFSLDTAQSLRKAVLRPRSRKGKAEKAEFELEIVGFCSWFPGWIFESMDSEGGT